MRVLLLIVLAVGLCRCNDLCVKIDQGKLIGKSGFDRLGNEFSSFLSIPYAKAPIGNLRFLAPQEPDNWKGVLNATIKHNPCTQKYFGENIGEEDCLFLNVHTPKVKKHHRHLKPVVVFIHGGAFIVGSGQDYGPEFLIPADVVLVTMNYRLGIFGFLSSDDETIGISGNAGLKDQNMALRWVKKNIKHFGGDPKNILLVRQSAGGVSVHLHTLSPQSKGLFHKAMVMSGSSEEAWASGLPNSIIPIGERMGVQSKSPAVILKELRRMPKEKILDIGQKDYNIAIPVHVPAEYSPIVEKDVPGAFLTSRPIDIINSGKHHKVPLMIGYTDIDGLFMEVLSRLSTGAPMIVTDMALMTPQNIRKQGIDLDAVHGKLKKFFFGDEEPGLDNLEKSVELFTNVWFISGISKAINAHVRRGGAPLYVYRISADTELNYVKRLTPETARYKGCTHIEDLSYIFTTNFTPEIIPGSEEDRAIDNMVNLVTNFVKYGIPRNDWLPMTPNKFNYMEINISSTPGVNLDKAYFDFWTDFYNEYS